MDNDWARPVVHFEIEALNPDALIPFYEAMFSWTASDGFIRQVAPGLGGPETGVGGHFRPSTRSGVNLYIQVRDLAESLALAQSLGGEVTLEPIDIDGGPSLAGIRDPEGNPITLVQQ